MRLNFFNRVPFDYNAQIITKLFTEIQNQVNGNTEGSISTSHAAMTAAPTSGTYAQGDFVRNSTPTELGSASSKYVIIGWICTASGPPATFVACRCLTGN